MGIPISYQRIVRIDQPRILDYFRDNYLGFSNLGQATLVLNDSLLGEFLPKQRKVSIPF